MPSRPIVSDGARAGDRILSPVIRLAPAKLNLTLAVLGRRGDGYHDLHSVVAPLALADRLSLARGHGGADSLRVIGRDAGPADTNLVLRAISAARARLRGVVDPWAVAALLAKDIPVAAGLGGGSSDAAAALDAVHDLWDVGAVLDPAAWSEHRMRIARELGSDVPLFLPGGPVVLTGRGEHIEPLPPLRGRPPGVLLVTPAAAASTPAVFAALDADPAARPPGSGSTRAASEHLAAEWRAGMDAAALVVRAGVLASANDLAAAADVVVPGLRPLRRALVRALGRPVGLSGSGPTLWVLYASGADAAAAADRVRMGLDDGSIVAPGDGSPSVTSTTIAAHPAPDDEEGTAP